MHRDRAVVNDVVAACDLADDLVFTERPGACTHSLLIG